MKPRISLGRSILAALSLMAICTVAWVHAGNLDPAGPPGPTMRTLQEIYDLVAGIFVRQEAELGGQVVGADDRLLACLFVELAGGPVESRDPIDEADPLCGVDGPLSNPTMRVFSLELSSDRLVGPTVSAAKFDPLRVQKNVDGASPVLFDALCTGAVISELRVHLFRDDGTGTPEPFFVITMRNGKVVEYLPQATPTTGSSLHQESWGFIAQEIEWEYVPTGSLYGFNLLTQQGT